MWRALLTSISKVQKNLIVLAREVPGIADLSETDFNTLINRKSFEYYLICNAPLFINNECFVSLSDEVRYTRKRMIKVGFYFLDRPYYLVEESRVTNVTNHGF